MANIVPLKMNESLDETRERINGQFNELNDELEHQGARINNIVSQSGDDITEIVDAREGYDTLRERLESTDNSIAETVFYDEITHEKLRDTISNTDYWLTYIPHRDAKGELIELKHGFQNDEINSGDGETARSFANRHITSFASNASVWDMETELLHGIQIQDGVIIQSAPYNRYTLGWKADNTLIAYPPEVSAEAIIADGCVNAVTGFYPLIENGTPVDPSVYSVSGKPTEQHPRQVIAQLANKDIIYLTCDGRKLNNKGMTYLDCIRILLEKSVVFAYNLDGGGSSTTVVRGSIVNRPVDDSGFTERKVGDFIYIQKPSINPQKLKTVGTDLGVMSKRITDLEAQIYNLKNIYGGLINLVSDPSAYFPGVVTSDGEINFTKLQLNKNSFGYYDYVLDSSIFNVDGGTGNIRSRKGTLGMFLSTVKRDVAPNDIAESGFYWSTPAMAGNPASDVSWFIIHVQIDASNKMQLAVPFHNTLHGLKMRRTGTWETWRDL